MKKKVFGRKLSRDRGSRRALFRSLVKAMLERGTIVTTKAKVKAVQPLLERLVSVSKTKDVSVVRRVFSYLGNDAGSLKILFGQLAPLFQNRRGGFTRMVNLPRRKGDNAEMARIEWTEKVDMSGKKETVVEKKNKKEKIKTEPATLRSKVAKLVGSGRKK